MNKLSVGSALAVLALVAASPAHAQLQLPAPSPAAMVKQTVGLTDITVEYSSPAVKNRKIWGALVPYEKPWRTGANAATKITFSREVTVGGKPVPAGTYSIVTFPGAKEWSVALNKDTTLFGMSGKPYDAKDDVTRVTAKPAVAPMRERMTFLFSNTADDKTSLDLEWEKLRVSVPIQVDTKTQVMASIKTHVEGAWRAPANAARYLAESSKEYDTALKYADTSLMLESNWYNNWIKADVLARKGNYAEARKFAQVAWEKGEKDESFFLKDQVSKALAEWKSK